MLKRQAALRGPPAAHGSKRRDDAALAEAGTDKFRILTAQAWLSNMANFAAMNAVRNAWVDPENPPSRACVSGDLFLPQALVEIVVTALIEERQEERRAV